MGLSAEVRAALLKPFAATEIKTKPGAGGKSLAFIDARDAMQRLDDVLGEEGWSFRVTVVHTSPTRAVVQGSLTVAGVTREDVGEAIGKETEELVKSATSDALKRAAVHFGVGRHLYEMGPVSGHVTEQQVAASAKKAGYKEAVHCAQCAGVIEDIPGKMSAESIVALGIQRYGRPVCPPCGKKMGEAEKARVPTGELVGA